MSNGIRVQYDDDGNPFVAQDELQEMLAGQRQEIEELKEALIMTAQGQTNQNHADQLRQSVVGEKPEYQVANERLQNARHWLGQKCNEYIEAQGWDDVAYLTSGQALNVFAGTSVEAEFKKQFDGMDMLTALTAEDSLPQLRRALDDISAGIDFGTNDTGMDQFSVIDPLKVVDVDGKGYSDKEIKALESALAKEEAKGIL